MISTSGNKIISQEGETNNKKVLDIFQTEQIDRNSPTYQVLNSLFEAGVAISEIAMTLDQVGKDILKIFLPPELQKLIDKGTGQGKKIADILIKGDKGGKTNLLPKKENEELSSLSEEHLAKIPRLLNGTHKKINGIDIIISWVFYQEDHNYGHYEIYFPQIEKGEYDEINPATFVYRSDQVLYLGKDWEESRQYFDYACKLAEKGRKVEEIYDEISKYGNKGYTPSL